MAQPIPAMTLRSIGSSIGTHPTPAQGWPSAAVTTPGHISGLGNPAGRITNRDPSLSVTQV
jgi:hypothetical protein